MHADRNIEEPASKLSVALLTWGVRIAVACGVAFALSVIPYRAMGGNQKLDEMNTQLAAVENEIAATALDLRRRQRLVQALKTDTRAIEKIARDELQMLYPHEKTLRLDIKGRQP